MEHSPTPSQRGEKKENGKNDQDEDDVFAAGIRAKAATTTKMTMRMVSELQGRRSGCGDLYAQETANAFRVEPSQAALLLNERAMRLKAAAT